MIRGVGKVGEVDKIGISYGYGIIGMKLKG